jgi:hypothetical protein
LLREYNEKERKIIIFDLIYNRLNIIKRKEIRDEVSEK